MHMRHDDGREQELEEQWKSQNGKEPNTRKHGAAGPLA